MAIHDEQRKSKLDKVKESLYDKYADIHPKKRSDLHTRVTQSKTSWDDSDLGQKAHFEKIPMKKNKATLVWVKRFFLISLGIFVLAGLFAMTKLLTGGNLSTGAVELTLLTQPFVDGGENLPVTIQLVNNNATQIETADIIFEYPTTSFADGEIRRERVSLNTVKAGETLFQDFDIKLFGEEGEERTLTAKVEYRVQGSNAIVVNDTTTVVTIRSTPIQVLVEGRDASIPNQEYTFDIIVNSNATTVTSNIITQVEYPQGFTFISAEPVPSFDVNTWVLGDIEPGTSRTINVTGMLVGEVGDGKVFRVSLGEQDPRNERKIATIYGSQTQQVSLAPSFLDARIAVSGNSSNRLIIPAAQKTTVNVVWQNTLPVQLRNITLEAELSGNAYTVSGVTGTDGFYDSNTNTVRWDPTTSNVLDTVNPGAQGTFRFELQPRPLASSSGEIINQPVINVILRASGIDGVGQVQQSETIASTQLVVNSDVRLEPKTLHFGGPFVNAGSVPPIVGQTTEFTLVWQITNSSSNLRAGTLTTRLPSYVVWQNVKTPSNENLVYNTATRELIWDLGQVNAGAGFTQAAREVSFKVAITPSVTQLAQVPTLTESLVFEAEDTYTGGTIRVVRNPHTTRLLNDINLNNGVVQ
jgi:hypothetical protein